MLGACNLPRGRLRLTPCFFSPILLVSRRVLAEHSLRFATIACGARVGRTRIGLDRAHRKFGPMSSPCIIARLGRQASINTLALSIAGPQDERWRWRRLTAPTLGWRVVKMPVGGTRTIAEIVPHIAQTHRLRDSMLASCQHPRP